MGTKITFVAGGAPHVREKKRFRTDARLFALGMFKLHVGSVRAFGMSLNFNARQMFNSTSPTSMRRQWSILTGQPMWRDRQEHPRPWEGPKGWPKGRRWGEPALRVRPWAPPTRPARGPLVPAPVPPPAIVYPQLCQECAEGMRTADRPGFKPCAECEAKLKAVQDQGLDRVRSPSRFA